MVATSFFLDPLLPRLRLDALHSVAASKLLKLPLLLLNMPADANCLPKHESRALEQQVFSDMTRRSTFDELISDNAVDAVTEVARRKIFP